MFYTLKTYLRLLIVALVVLFIQLSLSILPVLSQDIKIGTQIWTSKNLDVSTFRNGDPIPQVQDKEAWRNLTTGAWCYYDNDRSSNRTKYGKLYNWYAVNDPRGLAPKGYHIPSDEEWTILTNFLGGESYAGNKLKSKIGWHKIVWHYNGNGDDSYGFIGLPGGTRINYGTFVGIGTEGNWWSSTEHNTNFIRWQQRLPVEFYGAWSRNLNSKNEFLGRGYIYKEDGLSVRCLRD